MRRLDIADTDLAFDIEATFAADPSVIWAHLTSPALRTRWEGPITIEETSAGGRRGVGTTAQCVTGRLATLEEIVDWQPYDRVAWRLAVPGVGPVAATADLEPTEDGTRLRLRWAYEGAAAADAAAVAADAGGEGGRLRAARHGHRRRAAGRRAEGGSSMSASVAEQVIERSAQDVWAYAADIVRHPEWMTVTDARIVRGDGTQVGARGRERLRFGPFGWDVEFEVAEAEPGRRIAWKSVHGAPIRSHGLRWTSSPLAQRRPRRRYGADIRLHGLWRLLSPMVAMEAKAGPARELSRLKTQVEAAPAMAPAMS